MQLWGPVAPNRGILDFFVCDNFRKFFGTAIWQRRGERMVRTGVVMLPGGPRSYGIRR